jgi:hypothetical protein
MKHSGFFKEAPNQVSPFQMAKQTCSDLYNMLNEGQPGFQEPKGER